MDIVAIITVAVLGMIIMQVGASSGNSKEYKTWDDAFKRLQEEKTKNGMSAEYWRIWYDEVCPAYRKLSDKAPFKTPETKRILEDMDKPVSQRKYF